MVESGMIGRFGRTAHVPDGRGGMLRKSPVALARRHHPEMALLATRGRRANTDALLTVAKRA
jgi:hypothetical protein